MNTRFLLVGTIVGAIALFAWQTVSNAALPWHMATMRTFESDSVSAQALRAAMPENGVWLSTRGVVAAVSMRADMADKSVEMGGMLARQLALDLVVALVLCLVVTRLPAASATTTGVTLAMTALAVAGILAFSDWIWYGFTFPYAAVNVIDMGINGLVGGMVLGALRNRSMRAAGVAAPGGVGVGMGEPARR